MTRRVAEKLCTKKLFVDFLAPIKDVFARGYFQRFCPPRSLREQFFLAMETV